MFEYLLILLNRTYDKILPVVRLDETISDEAKLSNKLRMKLSRFSKIKVKRVLKIIAAKKNTPVEGFILICDFYYKSVCFITSSHLLAPTDGALTLWVRCYEKRVRPPMV